jgi:uncharacterized Zn-finger protein
MRKPPPAQNYECPGCKKAFSRKDSLDRHRRKHPTECGAIPAKGAPEVCPLCNKAVSRHFSLERHMRNHKTSQDYTCPKCGKTFTENYGLQRHIRSHKDPPKEDGIPLQLSPAGTLPSLCTYHCIICGLSCQSHVMIDTHFAVAHLTSGRVRLRVV